MTFLEWFAWLESTAPSLWARESGGVFFSTLVVHSLALGTAVGVQVAFNLRLLGVAKQVPLAYMLRFMPVMWAGVGLALLSGVVLLLAYPAKALMNPVFYFKLTCIIVSLLLYLRFVASRLEPKSGSAQSAAALTSERALAVASLSLWVMAVTAGRFLAYTNSVLLASDYF